MIHSPFDWLSIVSGACSNYRELAVLPSAAKNYVSLNSQYDFPLRSQHRPSDGRTNLLSLRFCGTPLLATPPITLLNGTRRTNKCGGYVAIRHAHREVGTRLASLGRWTFVSPLVYELEQWIPCNPVMVIAWVSRIEPFQQRGAP
jgi:hypothetical protein